MLIVNITILYMCMYFALTNTHSCAYVTHDDVCRCFHGDTMLTVQAPSGTQLEVPIPESVRVG